MTTKAIRLDNNLVSQATSAATIQRRSVSKQLEYWATIGSMISSEIGVEDAIAIFHGLKKVRLETAQTMPIDSDTVFNNLEADRANQFVNKPITAAPFYFEISQKKPGLLDKVDTATGERKTGKFENGKFTEVNV